MKRYLVLVALLVSLSACNKTKVIEASDITVPVSERDSSEQASSEQSNSEPSNSRSYNKLKELEKAMETVDDFSNSFDKKTVTNKKIAVTPITDEARKADLINLMKASLNAVHTSIKYKNSTSYDVILGTPEKATRKVKNGFKEETEEYETGNTKFNRYMGDISSEITRKDKVYHSLYVIDKTAYGYNSVDVKDTYLIDSGSKTISYSKEYDKTKDFEEKIPYKAYTVDRDLDTETVNFATVDVLGNGEEYEMNEEDVDGVNYYTYKSLIPLKNAMEIANVNTDMLNLPDISQYKAVIVLKFDRNDTKLKKAIIYLKDVLEKVRKDNNLGNNLQVNQFKTEIVIDSLDNTELNLPSAIEKKLPNDVKANLNKDTTSNGEKTDEALVMDGDFTVYGE